MTHPSMTDSGQTRAICIQLSLCSLFSSFLLLAACYSFYSANKEVTLGPGQSRAPVLVSGLGTSHQGSPSA